MKWLTDLIYRLFQSAKEPVKVPSLQGPTQVIDPPPVAEPSTPEPVKIVVEPVKDNPLFGGGKSGGGGATGVIPEPEPPKPPIKQPSYDEAVTYHEALRLILRFEGGYINDKDDPGGETNKGITKDVYDCYREAKGQPAQSVKNITDEEVSSIYRKSYWLVGNCDKLTPCLSIAHFDTCVNAGTNQAAKILQRTVGAKDDGSIGSGTLKKLASKLSTTLDLVVAQEYLVKRRAFYNSLVQQKPDLQKFLKGWLNRVDALEKYLKDRKA